MRLRRTLPRVAAAFAVAAGLLLALLVWRGARPAEQASPPIVSRPASDEKRAIELGYVGTRPDEYVYALRDSRPASDAEAAIELQVERAGSSAQMLAAADLLAAQPAGREIACERYRYIATECANYPAAEIAAERLASLCTER
jgi:hypothetical protein